MATTDLDQRLSRCFQTVFPDLSEAETPAASTSTVGQWDSVATITLLSVIQEEFNLEVSLDDYEELGSYALVRSYLAERLGE